MQTVAYLLHRTVTHPGLLVVYDLPCSLNECRQRPGGRPSQFVPDLGGVRKGAEESLEPRAASREGGKGKRRIEEPENRGGGGDGDNGTRRGGGRTPAWRAKEMGGGWMRAAQCEAV